MIKELFRASLWCLFIALAMNTAFTYSQGLGWQGMRRASPPDMPWMIISFTDPGDHKTIRPELTVITTSNQPVVKSTGKNQWEIHFTP